MVWDFGVVNNSTELQTEKLQAILNKCKENGGIVIFPEGKYYTGSLYVSSNTTATFVGATDERPILNIPKGTTNIRAYYED